MKKVMTLLFLLAMMALCMAGCGTEKKKQFRQIQILLIICKKLSKLGGR